MAQKVLVEEHRGIEDKRPWPACCRGAVCLCRVVVPVGGGSNIPIGVVEIIYLAILYHHYYYYHYENEIPKIALKSP